ncbi:MULTISPECIES: SDR family NAD(P)-dependent oxidoreductase [Halolamina]|uniref:Short-chain dehydrogenase n=1 Tax=Halolamina pelagica TaxID=699431 RepID=A0A1I5T4Q7_9EURY|nr:MULTISPECIES: SDR family NAD(P)-dependent oxidoreductase [Halolamina]NHX37464.1 SDR family NAD(P)-dependent oxidoreductase [Halolamina sp. R1-12]SFP77647.1 Short-chain dehydrogenase [Halolamina pelagica]
MSSSDMDEHVVLLTGGTSGIGRIAATELAKRGATVGVVGRDRSRGESLAAESSTLPGEIRFHRADLGSQSAVRSLATEIQETYDRLDVLAHNAGLSVSERTETADGIERTLAVNHLAPYLLTHELLDIVLASAPARIVTTGSEMHRRDSIDFEDLQFERDYDALQAYSRSKHALIAFTLELADRVPKDVTANSFHPGFVPSTNLFRDAALTTRLAVRIAGIVPGVGTSERAGGRRLVRLATAPEFGDRTGVYVTGDGVVQPADEAVDPEIRARLWRRSAELVGVDPAWP